MAPPSRASHPDARHRLAREQLHVYEEAERARQGRPRTRVDVSDPGLTMDDLTTAAC